MPTYAYTDVAADIKSDYAGISNMRRIVNRAAREVFSDLDLRSAKRKSSLSPDLLNDIHAYTAPTDLKDMALIDVSPQVNRSSDEGYDLVPQEEFDRMKSSLAGIVAIQDDSFIRKLLISALITDHTLVIEEMDSASGWSAFGDGASIALDNDQFVKGNGSIQWDINSDGGTTAGIQKSTGTAFDITNWLSAGSLYVFAYITSATNLTNYKLRIGSDASNYYEWTVTADAFGTAFAAGWMLLKFTASSYTASGSPDITNMTYRALYMTKAGGKQNELDYRFDWLVIKRGVKHDVWYYSKYPWQTSGGTWIVNSTVDSDKINVDDEEYDLIIKKGRQLVYEELKQGDEVKEYKKQYEDKRDHHRTMVYPSERKVLISSYHTLSTLSTTPPRPDRNTNS